jgi:hypothetical protein
MGLRLSVAKTRICHIDEGRRCYRTRTQASDTGEQ